MLGIVRFVLAILVLLSHASGTGFKLNLGIVAVIIFYFTSGYLMRRSYGRFVSHSKTPIRDFYLDRVLKLFPQYSLVVLASFAAIACFGPAQYVLFMNQEPALDKILLNLALLPANYVFPPFIVEGMLPHPIIPPAWSLSAEFHFYLLLPLIFLLSRRGFIALIGIVASIQIGALFFANGNFNSDNFGYRFIFGALTFFLFGYAYASREDLPFKQVTYFIWLIYTCLLLLIAPAFKLFNNPQVMELLVGAVLALPLVSAALNSKPQELWLRKFDTLLGRLAYPIFISHFLSFYLCEKLLSFTGQQGPRILVAILVCLCISYVLMRLQDTIDSYRLRRRGFSSMAAKY